MLAVIPYTTFPLIELGPLHIRTFGLMVALGVLVGAMIAARYLEAHGIDREETYRLATRLVVAGVVGARISWAISHWSELHSPVDVIAVWNGGLQFSGGFIAAVLVAVPAFRKWDRALRWTAVDAYAYGLTLGLAFGRVGCTSVGEHFGRDSSFPLAVRYDGGTTREPVRFHETFHQTAIYELLFLLVIFGVLTLVASRRGWRPVPGTLIGVFTLAYGVCRFATDSLRVNDERVLHLTGAQWLMIAVVLAGVWIMARVRPRNAAAAASAVPQRGADAEPDAAEPAAG